MSAEELRKNHKEFDQDREAMNPFDLARREWDDRIGTLKEENQFTRKLLVGALVVIVGLIGFIVFLASKSDIEPWLVTVDVKGNPINVVKLKDVVMNPTQLQLSSQLGNWIGYVRAISSDKVVLKNNWLKAYGFVTPKASLKLNSYAETNDPFFRKVTIVVDMVSILPISPSSYQARWTETVTLENGKEELPTSWTGIFTITMGEAETPEELMLNPLGLFIDDFNWQREN
ncbi:type IV secretion system protein VirB5 [Rheinheimera pacifica]|uniref:conjugal transfer protein TrbF n=1 Tax=Rheinheimera pacifica TaxID=173990 RepID=UPI0021694939|nr:conjugal transfer protein TrbF [Rheinheimera pacifica]MCS4309501.1 type IV secretion system protein VirB5 [Rheinheimera pacifica]